MSKFLRAFPLLLFSFVFLLVGCGGDDDEPSLVSVNLVGSWYGTRYYNNSVGGIKYQYLTVNLNSDGTGTLEYEAPESMSMAFFQWTRSGNYVDCRGAYGASSGDYSGDFSFRLLIDGERLRPQGQFSVFILGKGTPIVTDGNGNEVEDPDDQLYRLQNVWKSTDGYTVVCFYPGGDYNEYVLTTPFGKEYKSQTWGTYEFFPLQKQLSLNSTLFDVLEFTATRLVLKHGTSTFTYTLGTEADIPSGTNLKAILSAPIGWVDKNYKYMFCFDQNGKVEYMEDSKKSVGSAGTITMRAQGTYTVSGSRVTCNFSDVYWNYGTTTAKNFFPGWTCGQACTKTYDVEVTATGDIYVELPTGVHVYLSKY